jgi:hypothetical protein
VNPQRIVTVLSALASLTCGPAPRREITVVNRRSEPPEQSYAPVDAGVDGVAPPHGQGDLVCEPGLRPRDGNCVPPDGMPCVGGCLPGRDWTDPSKYHSDEGDPFDRAVVAMALGRVDLSGCRAESMPPPHGHIRISFLPSGVVEGVLVDLLVHGDDEVKRCIASRFGAVHISKFRGHSQTMGRSF